VHGRKVEDVEWPVPAKLRVNGFANIAFDVFDPRVRETRLGDIDAVKLLVSPFR
jgi:hypothetical protein